MGFDWKKVFPAWFSALSARVAPAECARRVDAVLDRHYVHGRAEMLFVARRTATPAQRLALAQS